MLTLGLRFVGFIICAERVVGVREIWGVVGKVWVVGHVEGQLVTHGVVEGFARLFTARKPLFDGAMDALLFAPVLFEERIPTGIVLCGIGEGVVVKVVGEVDRWVFGGTGERLLHLARDAFYA